MVKFYRRRDRALGRDRTEVEICRHVQNPGTQYDSSDLSSRHKELICKKKQEDTIVCVLGFCHRFTVHWGSSLQEVFAGHYHFHDSCCFGKLILWGLYLFFYYKVRCHRCVCVKKVHFQNLWSNFLFKLPFF